jgi:archaeosine-15-forming tRNA-guanine transglycosylase
MATVFAQMYGNAIGTRLLSNECRLNRIRIGRTARVAQGGNVINVDA